MSESFAKAMEYIFQYRPEAPLIFSDALFWAFFLVVLGIYQLLYRRNFGRNLFLTLFSLFFYYKAGGIYFLLLIFSTWIDYYFGRAIYRSQVAWQRTSLLVGSLVVNLGLLSYFKYAYLFTDFINYLFGTDFQTIDYLALSANALFGSELDITQILLPVGISFYTFQTMSYSLDIYRRRLEPVRNILDFAFFVSFFPQLVAGPIVRASEFIPQIYQPYRLNNVQYQRAIFLILAGLTKKMLVSDYISINFVDRIFANPLAYTGLENLMGVYGYAIQIYCDFSGYTDIAIGIALLLGYQLPLNFNSPYKSESITDFWRRWHISLSSWLRDYLYISLGGNRGTSLFTYGSVPLIILIAHFAEAAPWVHLLFFGNVLLLWLAWRASGRNIWAYIGLHVLLVNVLYLFQLHLFYLATIWVLVFLFWFLVLARPAKAQALSTYLNLMLTMLLGGLWHGAHLKFIIWGGLHGAALALHKFWMELLGKSSWTSGALYRFLMQVLTFHFVCFCWIFFRANDVAIDENTSLSALQVVGQILHQIAYSFQGQLFFEIIGGYKTIFGIILLGFVVHWLPSLWKQHIATQFARLPDFAKALLITLLVLALYQAKSSDIQPFIYFQF